MSLLESTNRPQDLRRLSRTELETLARQIRTFLVTNVSRTGGHLGPNLGVVELTIALHRVFDSPTDPIVFDTGHQSYVHKLLTGRRDQFSGLRQADGLSGYPARDESEHDWVENSHASAALSWAYGMARAKQLRHEDGIVVAVVGDGSLTGGMAWEAMNNIAVADDLRLVVVVNDNGRSYTPTVGGIADQLSSLRTDRRYEQVLDVVKRSLSATPIVGGPLYDVLHGVKSGLKDVLSPQGLFGDLGVKYLGPVDGHDVLAVERAMLQAKSFDGPVIVHCITRKGMGFRAAEEHEEDNFHAVGKIDAITGEPLSPSSDRSWTGIFGNQLVRLASDRPELVAISAAMIHPTGLAPFQAAFPSRTFDVGIAEQHAITMAAGMAAQGLHPVVALYSTFLNRGFDQLLMDVGLHHAGVTFAFDRAGVTGPDGPSHHGMWDCSLLAMVPGLELAAPRDERRLEEALARAVDVQDRPTALRYGKYSVPEDLPAVSSVDGVDVMRRDSTTDPVLIVAYGPGVQIGLAVAEQLSHQGIAATVVDPVWALPHNPALVELARGRQLVATIEDGLIEGGLGSGVAQLCADAGVSAPVRNFGVPKDFWAHGSRDEVLAACGLTPEAVARSITEALLALDPAAVPAAEVPSQTR
ncbi:1-deoxy-D-xylulose-5-phosphate synthase [Parenemella sanctibonifatiensis]|uniref:1-deoxy-D-xylulose-5-phosphate synthase n=1 Tax=Parenemella sanctibonifatiensis TaxID=2016505 RepID=A0A255E642_9ACTN|nr:1-deoxy-D-xylulose-5-phosphate synthase [Parenemella sanctibonifatiensis]OYN86421.1 1-deoxy-D-xylulose-5-phosphate synthase [Parenemella sanctibonifatiensis]